MGIRATIFFPVEDIPIGVPWELNEQAASICVCECGQVELHFPGKKTFGRQGHNYLKNNATTSISPLKTQNYDEWLVCWSFFYAAIRTNDYYYLQSGKLMGAKHKRKKIKKQKLFATPSRIEFQRYIYLLEIIYYY